MSANLWNLQKHIILASHIRGFERGVQNEQQPCLKLAVNRYTPKNNPQPSIGDFTIVMVHGISSSKEAYEPLFDDLLQNGVPIRGVWCPDAVANCESYILNKDRIGDQIHWLDFSRDLMHMINHFQAEMPPPIIGIGQSLGVGNLMVLSAWHPRLFAGILAVEPGMGPRMDSYWPAPAKYFPGVMAAKRRDVWSSREDARADLRGQAYYKPFDERVFERVIKYELRDSEPSDHGEAGDRTGSVTLTTPKHVESYSFMLADPPLKGFNPVPEHNASRRETGPIGSDTYGFYRPDGRRMWEVLPQIYPPVLYVWGTNSLLAGEPRKSVLLGQTGIGVGGSGGVKAGKVLEAFVKGAGHPVSLEKPKELAKEAAVWLLKLKDELDAKRDTSRAQPPFRDRAHDVWMERISKL